jgi:hypothetical protein
MAFKEDCPHYGSREHIKKYDPMTVLPKDEGLHWCGDKGEWIRECDSPCERYNFLKGGK